jgi:hypothetical protein
MSSIVITSPPISADLTPCADGYVVIPHVLTIHVPQAAFGLTVAEFFGLDETPR